MTDPMTNTLIRRIPVAIECPCDRFEFHALFRIPDESLNRDRKCFVCVCIHRRRNFIWSRIRIDTYGWFHDITKRVVRWLAFDIFLCHHAQNRSEVTHDHRNRIANHVDRMVRVDTWNRRLSLGMLCDQSLHLCS